MLAICGSTCLALDKTHDNAPQATLQSFFYSAVRGKKDFFVYEAAANFSLRVLSECPCVICWQLEKHSSANEMAENLAPILEDDCDDFVSII